MLKILKFLLKAPFYIMGLIYSIFTTWYLAAFVFGAAALLMTIFYCKTKIGKIIVWVIAVIIVILVAVTWLRVAQWATLSFYFIIIS